MNVPVEHPVFYYAALALAMSACLFLFHTVKRDIASTDRALRNHLRELDRAAGRQSAHAATIESRLGEWSARTATMEEQFHLLHTSRRPGAQSIDANCRNEVLRLARLGQQPDRIAAELSLPRNEVDLLLKVHRSVIRTF